MIRAGKNYKDKKQISTRFPKNFFENFYKNLVENFYLCVFYFLPPKIPLKISPSIWKGFKIGNSLLRNFVLHFGQFCGGKRNKTSLFGANCSQYLHFGQINQNERGRIIFIPFYFCSANKRSQ